ncbi:DEAD/DEAH box helicase [Photobacterium kagoshimensis]|uniref:DEAD/DEAH box helicase n=1 Tax=Photobacterium kagoshimensis TaxID=2910242 RepID=UPI003D0F6391
MTRYFSELVEQSISRAQESTLSVLGITNPALRTHLSQQMSANCGEGEAFLAPPLFEHTFGWEFADPTFEELKGSLLSEAVVNALDDESNGRYRFEARFNPFKHQLEAWNTLLADEAQSAIVTSGTGSGKTECFMVPVLEDLYREYRQKRSPLVGVRALFLYPLNALINSQQERLDAWTQHFDEGIRYCLYNGNTENSEKKVRKAQMERPNEVMSRELMRKAPAPILVTNGTMLEYMLVRQVDAPIIERSRQEKSLRWIVLDEAHTYVGSQAAELSLQLRRVLQAFGVEAKNVRFVATSATIAGADANEQLKHYLADLAGVSTDQVKVIDGRRVIPDVDFIDGDESSLEQLELIEPKGEADKKGKKKADPEVSAARFHAIQSSTLAHAIRDVVVNSKKPLTLLEINHQVSVQLNQRLLPQSEMLRWLDLLTGTKPNVSKEAFLKVRAHFFQRMTNGLWSCIDKNCACKKNTILEGGWPFGYVYTVQRQKCDCGAPILELSFCTECNEPHLMGRDKKGMLAQWNGSAGDEFSLQHESFDDDEPAVQDLDASSSLPEIFASKLDKESFYAQTKIGEDCRIATLENNGYELTHDITSEQVCCDCGFSGFNGSSPFRRAMLGAPFYIANVVPTLLEYCPDISESDSALGPLSLPARGRRLITFTDSRQGTARLSVRMQQEAERSMLRGAVVEVLRERQFAQPENINQPVEGVDAAALLEQAKILRGMGMNGPAEELEAKAKELESGTSSPKLATLTWQSMVSELASKSDFKGAMLQYNQYMSPEVFKSTDGSLKLADLLLFREFARRPKRQNSSETQGLISIDYLGLKNIKRSPKRWEEFGLTLQDWLDFIRVSLDFYVRENSFLRIEEDGWRKWVGSRFSSKDLIPPSSEENDEMRIKKWPQIRGVVLNRLAKLLVLGSGVDVETNYGKDIVNDWLRLAWLDLTDNAKILKSDNKKFALNRESIVFSLSEKAYVCPVTNKLLSCAFKGFTPYLPRKIDDVDAYRCEEVALPHIWEFEADQLDYQKALTKIRTQVKEDHKVTRLRERNLWTDINDRAVEGGLYYRTAEHSAQQSAERLNDYEDLFKKGKINVLNCSTTMEMGVDIGGITAVVMNNVPPHPANYLQRAGRAGRSKESRAISYTLCKGNPHDQQVFANPKWPFVTQIPAPYVAFNSDRLVQRHVNSLLLSLFLKHSIGTTTTEKTSLNLEWFYLPQGDSVCDHFLAWLSCDSHEWDSDVSSLVRGTVLANSQPNLLRQQACTSIAQLKDKWFKEYHYLERELKTAGVDTPYAYRLGIEKIRLGKEYLLRELASKAFLPGYGFPTDVVNFDNNNVEDFMREKERKRTKKEEREDNVSRFRGLPSRNLAVAIREYAPGAEIVLDGRVFRSGGVALHWHNVSDTGATEAQKFDLAWRCDCCGQTGYETEVSAASLDMNCTNPNCGAPIKKRHIRQVLQPTGFATDFYYSPTNDISMQKFIPVESAWVSAGKANPIPLPNSNMGYMLSTTEGTVFNHTSGANGTGYALCLCCGRAESLTRNGDYPKELNPNDPHRPLKAAKKDKTGEGKVACDGSGTLMKDIHLGCHAKTDVFELVLKHPISNEYIPDSTDGRVIATTLSVALRSALAEALGISTSELGYAVRPAIVENGIPAMAIQIYDSISGGAGFASSANRHIQSLLTKMCTNLQCDKCDSGCSECLLESDTRHDVDLIDSAIASTWLGKAFLMFNQLPKELAAFVGGEYQPTSIALTLRNEINHGASSIILWLSDNVAEWDLTHPNFKRAIITYLSSDNLNVTLVVPQKDLEHDVQEELWLLQKMGVILAIGQCSKSQVAVQVIKADKVVTVATSESLNMCPGVNWHCANGIVVLSQVEPKQVTSCFDITFDYQNNSINDSIEVDRQLNGKLTNFGDAFWMTLFKRDQALLKLLSNNELISISYSDRYIQSPSSLLLIGQLISALCKVKKEVSSITIETLYHEKDRSGRMLHHDWQNKDDFSNAYEVWLEHKTSIKPKFVCHSKRSDIAHRRLITLLFASGRVVQLKLDQGVGYWLLSDPYTIYSTVKYDFNSDLQNQLGLLSSLERDLSVKNSESWSTDITYQER